MMYVVIGVTTAGRSSADIDLVPDFSNNQPQPDEPTLRRITLLAIRAAQDDETLRGPMTAICGVIDEVKRDVASGAAPEREKVVRLRSLLNDLTDKDATGRGIHSAILVELHDLGRSLYARVDEV